MDENAEKGTRLRCSHMKKTPVCMEVETHLGDTDASPVIEEYAWIGWNTSEEGRWEHSFVTKVGKNCTERICARDSLIGIVYLWTGHKGKEPDWKISQCIFADISNQGDKH